MQSVRFETLDASNVKSLLAFCQSHPKVKIDKVVTLDARERTMVNSTIDNADELLEMRKKSEQWQRTGLALLEDGTTIGFITFRNAGLSPLEVLFSVTEVFVSDQLSEDEAVDLENKLKTYAREAFVEITESTRVKLSRELNGWLAGEAERRGLSDAAQLIEQLIEEFSYPELDDATLEKLETEEVQRRQTLRRAQIYLNRRITHKLRAIRDSLPTSEQARSDSHIVALIVFDAQKNAV